MSESVERQFPAKTLLLGLRAIGYSFSTAVADIIDNSISAEATEIKIYSDPLADIPYFCILDNGYGMTTKELDNAMLFGSNREDKEECELELGRFGLGLKSASLSQCRKFIVASKKYGKIRAMAFDLDLIDDKLWLLQLDQDEIDSLPHINDLRNYETGTLVIWEKFDKIEGLAKNFEESFREAVAESKKHVEFVFHRFYNQIKIYYNEKRIERRDPFLTDSLGRQQTGRTSNITMDGSTITIIPYTLPFANTLTTEEKALLGNPKSIFDEQGFYLYRNKRLISWGSWMRMGIRSELNKLARIQVDIPSTLDSVWMLDVKKSSAKIPDKIRDRIRIAVEDSIVRSKRTVKNPGLKEATIEHKIWEKINEHDGNVRYVINRDNPFIQALSSVIGTEENELLEVLLSQIEACIPKYRIQNDVIDSLNIVNSMDDAENDVLVEQVLKCVGFFPKEQQANKLMELLGLEAYKTIADKKAELLKRLQENG